MLNKSTRRGWSPPSPSARRRSTVALALAFILIAPSCSSDEKNKDKEDVSTIAGASPLRRLTTVQYHNSIRDVFGTSVTITTELDRDIDDQVFSTIGAGSAIVSALAAENYRVAALEVAAQVVDQMESFDAWADCELSSATAPCIADGLATWGLRLWRRPISDAELDRLLTVVAVAGSSPEDLRVGIRYALSALLQSPNFLYIVEVGDDPSAERSTLTAFELASRLSFLLWNSVPDRELLDAAESGDLDTEEGLRAQVDRLLADPRSDDLLYRLLFDAWNLRFLERLGDLGLEQTFRTEFRLVVEDLMRGDEAFRRILDSDETFADGALATLYGINTEGGGESGPPAGTDARGYYDFEDGLATDVSGNGVDGVVVGAVATTGRFGDALAFDGNSNRVELGAIDLDGGDGITLSAWFLSNGTGAPDARLISKASGQEEADHWWMLSVVDNTQIRARLKLGNTTATYICDTRFSIGEWVHAAVTYDGSTVRLYKDGSECLSSGASGALAANAGVLATIGDNPAGPAKGFGGSIDEVRLYDRGLSANEITALLGQSGGQGGGSDFERVALPPERTGLLTSGALLGANAAPPFNSIIYRGLFVFERLLCRSLGSPPDGAEEAFEPPEDESPEGARALSERRQNAQECAGCHTQIDPVGLVFEGFNETGEFRGDEIDTSGDFEGMAISSPLELVAALEGDPRVERCLSQNFYTYWTGHFPNPGEVEAANALGDSLFDGTSFRDLVGQVVTTKEFRTIVKAN